MFELEYFFGGHILPRTRRGAFCPFSLRFCGRFEKKAKTLTIFLPIIHVTLRGIQVIQQINFFCVLYQLATVSMQAPTEPFSVILSGYMTTGFWISILGGFMKNQARLTHLLAGVLGISLCLVSLNGFPFLT